MNSVLTWSTVYILGQQALNFSYVVVVRLFPP